MDKKLVKFLIIFACLSIFLFLLSGFYFLSNNPAMWSREGRAVFVCSEMAILCVAALIAYAP